MSYLKIIYAVALTLGSVLPASATLYLGPGVRFDHGKQGGFNTEKCLRIACESVGIDGRCQAAAIEYFMIRKPEARTSREQRRRENARMRLREDYGIAAGAALESPDAKWERWKAYNFDGVIPAAAFSTMTDHLWGLLSVTGRSDEDEAKEWLKALRGADRVLQLLLSKPTSQADCDTAVVVDPQAGDFVTSGALYPIFTEGYRARHEPRDRLPKTKNPQAEHERGAKLGTGIRNRTGELLYAECLNQSTEGCISMQFYVSQTEDGAAPTFRFATLDYSFGGPWEVATDHHSSRRNEGLFSSQPEKIGTPISGQKLLEAFAGKNHGVTKALLKSLTQTENFSLEARAREVRGSEWNQLMEWVRSAGR